MEIARGMNKDQTDTGNRCRHTSMIKGGFSSERNCKYNLLVYKLNVKKNIAHLQKKHILINLHISYTGNSYSVLNGQESASCASRLAFHSRGVSHLNGGGAGAGDWGGRVSYWILSRNRFSSPFTQSIFRKLRDNHSVDIISAERHRAQEEEAQS